LVFSCAKADDAADASQIAIIISIIMNDIPFFKQFKYVLPQVALRVLVCRHELGAGIRTHTVNFFL